MRWVFGILGIVLVGLAGFFVMNYSTALQPVDDIPDEEAFDPYQENIDIVGIEAKIAKHKSVPDSVRAVYMTSYVAGSSRARNRVIDLIESTELNSVIIDIKDATGYIAFPMYDPMINQVGATSKRITDIESLLEKLHNKGIYVIGRVQVFQDPFLAEKWPDEAVRSISTGDVWRDNKGIAWMDVGSKATWDYTARIANEAYDLGFDEINFDYVRYPSDGDLSDVFYPISGSDIRADSLVRFFQFMYDKFNDTEIVISADVFGLTAVEKNDMGIGQIIERIAPLVDYIAPMVYPSHYANGFRGFANPADHPYDVVFHSMNTARKRLEAIGEDPNKLRPWLQDFDYKATYTADMVRAQIQATYDAGLNSWMIWDPRNQYTASAYKRKELVLQ
ncbi:MAG: putative glycoside hydrolase [Candidatus Nomurabacteria bacterium]|nr:putative glycoside hydrolase [Candidatus Nomurabacteria bacterium]